MFVPLIELLMGMNLGFSFQKSKYFSVSYLKWHFLPLVVTYSAVCYTFTHCPCQTSLFIQAFFSFLSPKHTIYGFIWWAIFFFCQSFFLWHKFCFRSQEHLWFKPAWSQNPGYLPSFSLIYYPKSTIKHTTFVHLP